MGQEILVIGGTRYFGIRLVEALLAAGERVTIATRGRTPDSFGSRVRRIAVDRGDATAMQAAFHGARFDVVYDQMCYGPEAAELAARVFAGRVGRYLMTSTIEVYDVLHGRSTRAYREDDLDLAQPVASPPTAYGDGKRRAEAVLLAARGLPVATLRLAHVLGGTEDFTGRLRGYVERVLLGEPLRHAAVPGATSFIDVAGVVELLAWAGRQDFLGPLNVGSRGTLTAPQLHARIASRLGREVLLEPVGGVGASPFDYAAPHALDTGRATALGWTFGRVADWLDALVDAHAAALSGQQVGA
ncbi:nucleoside-diphosphate-sugar epimerase [Pelomonas saccharophila]|uniref:Nucleoside-diphosphate-sugar epimerase n=1 Tax=Roseateles saccharophilus TaxID=304 RepID=A0ABU1YJB0_ROSSA|nr:NAD-dependent epimerase/dehydratase family protein [Roseateles saccharophilus]MDR7268943.1 nucleoside-diphosphate-sugar epimerase [Roseateles saccharophilus]